MPWPSLSATGSSTVLQRVQVGLDPQRPVDRLGVRQRVGHQAGVGGDEAGGLLSRARRRARRRTPRGAGLRFATPSATVLASFQSITPSRVAAVPKGFPRPAGFVTARASARSVRAATPASAARGRAARRAGRRTHGNATSPPASRTISCAAAASTARQRRSVTIPSSRAAATWHSVDGDRADRAQPVGRARPARRPTRGPSAGRPTRCRAARAGRRGRGARRRRPAAAAVEPRALAAARDPLLLGPEVVDVAEEDVGHRRPVGDRDRDRVVRQAALGVDRAVDRVDHDAASSGSPKSTVPRSSLTAVKRSALVVQRLELAEDGVLGRGVDHQRAVAALAARAGLAHPLGRSSARRRGCARIASVARRHSSEPVRVLRTIGDPHRAYPTVVSPTPAQLEAVKHPGGPLLVLGGAGTGKTTVARASASPGWCASTGLAPESILALTVSQAGADALRERIEERPRRRLRGADGHDVPRLLRARCCATRRWRPGVDPFATPVAPADRLAMLLERIDELPLASTTCAATRARCSARSSRRIDRLKDELVSPRTTRAWAATLPRTPRGATASASSPRSTPPTTACCRRPARSTSATSCSHAFRLLRDEAARARAAGRPLPPRARRRAAGRELRPGPAAAAARRPSTARSARPPTTTRRSTASAARRPRTCATSGPSGRRRRSCGWRSRYRCPRARSCAAARAVVEPIADRLEKALRGAPARRRRGRVLALRATSARRRRRWRPRSSGWSRARTSRPRTSACSCARSAPRARRSRSRSRSARCRTAWPARRRSSSAPRCATCWRGCGCSSTRATPARSCARSRARRSSCARSTSRA